MSITSFLLNCSTEDRIKAFNLLINHPDTEPIFDAKVTAIVRKLTAEIKLQALNLIKEDPECKAEIKAIMNEDLATSFDNCLLASELKPIKRTAIIETVLGLNDFADFEEHEPTIPEQINKLAERIESSPLEALGDSKETLIPETKMEKTFVKFIDFVLAQPVRDGKKLITNNLIHQFRKNLPDDIKPKTVNPRQWKKELFEYTRQKTDVAKPDKTSKGDNRGIRLVFPRNFNIGMLKCKLPVS